MIKSVEGRGVLKSAIPSRVKVKWLQCQEPITQSILLNHFVIPCYFTDSRLLPKFKSTINYTRLLHYIFQVETLEKKFRDFVITPNMWLAPLTRTEPVTGDILPPGPLVWDDNMSHIRDVVKEMKSKQKYQTDQLSCDLEIICISKPNEVCLL